MSRKGQGLPMQTIVIAILVILVLGFLSYILVAKGIGPFSKALAECTEKGGVCKKSPCNPTTEIKSFAGCFDADNEFQKENVCCLSLT